MLTLTPEEFAGYRRYGLTADRDVMVFNPVHADDRWTWQTSPVQFSVYDAEPPETLPHINAGDPVQIPDGVTVQMAEEDSSPPSMTIKFDFGEDAKEENPDFDKLWKRIADLKPKLMDIVESFLSGTVLSEDSLEDVVIVGSATDACRFHETSDIDLHLVIDTDKIGWAGGSDQLGEYLWLAAAAWNSKHHVVIGNHVVELYLEQAGKPAVSGGRYSVMKGRWIDKPEDCADHKKAEDADIDRKTESVSLAVEQAIVSNDYETMQGMLDRLRDMRQTGLAAKGESSPENEAYRAVRRKGLLDKLKTAARELYDADLSVQFSRPVSSSTAERSGPERISQVTADDFSLYRRPVLHEGQKRSARPLYKPKSDSWHWVLDRQSPAGAPDESLPPHKELDPIQFPPTLQIVMDVADQRQMDDRLMALPEEEEFDYKPLHGPAEHPKTPPGGLFVEGRHIPEDQFLYREHLEGLSPEGRQQVARSLFESFQTATPDVPHLMSQIAPGPREHLASAFAHRTLLNDQIRRARAANMSTSELQKESQRTQSHAVKLIQNIMAREREAHLQHGLREWRGGVDERSAIPHLAIPSDVKPARGTVGVEGGRHEGQPTQYGIAKTLTEQNSKKFGRLDIHNSEDQERIADTLANETEFALSLDTSAKDWYDHRVKSARRLISDVHPSVSPDHPQGDNNWSMFAALTAITSQGMPVVENMDAAHKLYQQWEETDFKELNPELFRSNKSGPVRSNLNLLQSLVTRYGPEKTQQLLMMELPVGGKGRQLADKLSQSKRNLVESIVELKGRALQTAGVIPEKPGPDDLDKTAISGENSDQTLLGAMLFGSKIGSFYGNLMGNFNSTTTDLWFMRTLGRVSGTLVDVDPKHVQKQAGEILRQVQRERERYRDRLTRKQILSGLDQVEQAFSKGNFKVNWRSPLGKWMQKQYKDYASGRYSARGKPFEEKSDVNRLIAAVMTAAGHKSVEVPKKGKDFTKRFLLSSGRLQADPADAVRFLKESIQQDDPLEGQSYSQLKKELTQAMKTGEIDKDAKSTLLDWMQSRHRQFIIGQPRHTKERLEYSQASEKPSYINRSGLNLALKTLDQTLFSTKKKEAPGTGKNAASIRSIMGKVQERLADKGQNLNAATIQALLWFLEKDLYSRHGYRSPRGVPADYEDAARVLHARYAPRKRTDA